MVSVNYQIGLIDNDKTMDFSLFSKIYDEYRQMFIDRFGFDPDKWARENPMRFRMLEIENGLLMP